jgi:DMSO reductase anchor subunit
MTQTITGLVGNSFKLGYRLQSYWDTSMAIAFFSAEVGTGLFLVSYFLDFLPGMILGLIIAGTLKPYLHLAHMGVPSRSWRAIVRPDRSWISRGAISIAALIGFGVLHVANRSLGLGLPALVGYLAVAAAMVVVCYQGMAMAHSEAFTLWASPLVPLASICYALTAGVMLALSVGWTALSAPQQAMLATLAWIMPVVDLLVVVGILLFAKGKSKGGAFSVEMLLHGEYAGRFRNFVLILGLVVPVSLVVAAGGSRLVMMLATAAMLIGFCAFRILMFKAAVFEPISHDLAGSIGLPAAR